MIVRKLISSEKKPLVAKPPNQKPPFKTYRQLLNLDKPRKKIELESEEQDQNFLEKLLEQQIKKKKKPNMKRKAKVNQIDDRSHQQLNNQLINQLTQQQKQSRVNTQKQQRKDYLEIAFRQDNRQSQASRDCLHTARDSAFQLDPKFNKKNIQQIPSKQENQIHRQKFDANPQIASFQVTRRRGLNSERKARSSTGNKDILIDEKSCQIFRQNIYPFVPRNELKKNNTAVNLLAKEVHKKPVEQKHFSQKIKNGVVLHTIQKSKSVNSKKQLPVYSTLALFPYTMKKQRNELFKNLRQQQLFMLSLKQGSNTKNKNFLERQKQENAFSNRLF